MTSFLRANQIKSESVSSQTVSTANLISIKAEGGVADAVECQTFVVGFCRYNIDTRSCRLQQQHVNQKQTQSLP